MFYGTHSEANQKTNAIIDWLRAYAQRSINSQLIDERRCIPPHIILEFGNQGLFGLQIPQNYSGLGLPYQDTIRVMQQLGAIDLTLATTVSTHANGVYPLQHYGSEALKNKFLPAFAQGREICAFGLTEISAGSNPHAISTTAIPIDQQHWRINGKKIWVDSGSWASLMIVFVYLQEYRSTTSLLSAFAVPLNIPNVSIEEEALTLGLHGMVQNHIGFHNAIISKEYLLGVPGDGMDIAQQALTIARLMLAAKCIGAMKYCVQLMQRYANQRKVATGLLFENPVVMAWLFEISSSITSIENLIQWLAERLDAGKQDPKEIFFIVKNVAAEWLWKTTDLTIQTLGGRGYMECNGVSRMLRDARTMRISEGPTEPLTMTLGANIMNAGKAFYDFIDKEFANHQLAESLIKTTSAIQRRCASLEKNVNSNQSAAIQWGYFLAGEITSQTFLLAALEYQIAHKPTESLHLAHSWLTSKLADLTTQVLRTTPVENIFCHKDKLNHLIDNYAHAIGIIEQSAAFANYQLDPLLSSKNMVSSQTADTHIQYWQQQLSSHLPTLHIVSDFPRKTQIHRFNVIHLALEPQLILAIKERVAKEGITLQAFFLTSFFLLLHRYTHSEDILIGLQLSRSKPFLPIKINLPSATSPSKALQQVHDDLVMAKIHQDFDLFQLADHLQETVHLNLFEKLTVLLSVNEWSPILGLDHLELVLVYHEHNADFQFHYSEQLFQIATIERLTQHFKMLINELIDFKHAEIRQLAVLSADETHLLLNTFNNTATNYPKDQCLHELFEQQVKQRGGEKAVILQDTSLTYQQLNDQANQVAYYLQQKGVGAGIRVGLFLDHSLELLIGLLGILKTGAAYVPMDPNYPAHRIEFVLQDATLQLILTRRNLKEKLPPCAIEILALDDNTQDINAVKHPIIQKTVSSADVAYILYTSGSTGTPKGVCISHSAVVNFLYAMQKSPGIVAQDVMLAHTTIAFDIAGLEIYLPLISGASLVLSPRHITLDSQAFLQYIKQHQVSFIQATPTMWQMLINAGWQGDPKLKILSGGEALPADLAQTLAIRSKEVWNMYGPTEVTIWCAVYPVTQNTSFVSTPIGKPIANTQFYVLDPDKRLTPLGVSGELYIGGEGLAQGYWNRPDLNEERFIEYHFNKQQKARLYKTGDLVKYLPDGNVIFLGRIDRQIKLRGFRIEPGEIEHALRQFPSIDEAVVTTKQASVNDIRLVAYLLAQINIDEAVCRQYLQQQLPAYMLPNLFVTLSEFPLTANGKIDHNALPEPSWEKSDTKFAIQDIDDPLQRTLMQIWVAVLGTQNLTVHSNFFTVGGHSLLAAQIVGKITQEFSIELSLHEFFNHPSIAELALLIENSQQTDQQIITPQADAGLSAPATLQQYFMMFRVNHLPPAMDAMNNLILAFEVTGSFDTQKLEAALKTLLQRHHILSSAFVFDQHNMQFVTDANMTLPLKELDLADLSSNQQLVEANHIITADKKKTFDLTQAPLWRAGIIHLSTQKHMLYFVIHHLIVDGTSGQIFYNELVQFYNHNDTTLNPLSIQYADYAFWQQRWLESGNLTQQLVYWQNYLAGAPQRLILQGSLPILPEINIELGEYEFLITTTEFSSLQQFCSTEKITLFPLLMAVYMLLLYQYTQQEDIVLGYANTNRQYHHVEELIGLFYSQLVLRITIHPQSSFQELLTQVKQHIISHFKYSYLPIEAVIKNLHIEREPHYHPIYQMLLLLEDELMCIPFTNTEVKPIHYPSNFAKTDLILICTRVEEILKFRFEYKAILYSAEMIANLAQDLKQLLLAVVKNPSSRIQELISHHELGIK